MTAASDDPRAGAAQPEIPDALGGPNDGAAPPPAQGRVHFQQQLLELQERALGGLDLVVEQLDRVMEALNHQDVELAQMVIADDDRLDGRYLEVHQGILSLLALQAPVAGRPAPRGRAVARDHARRADGRSVREHRQADPPLRPRAAGAPRGARRAPEDGRAGALGGHPVARRLLRARRRTGRGPGAPGPRDQPPEPRHLPHGASRSARTPTRASGRCT